MNIVRKINEELAIAGKITPAQLQEIADEGYKSVLNLRLPDEKGLLTQEQEQAEYLGLYYINLPTKVEDINHQATLSVIFANITELPKPTLIHCDNSIRSAAIVFLYIATKQGIAFEEALEKTIQLGLIKINAISNNICFS